jgi:hypothetical protein
MSLPFQRISHRRVPRGGEKECCCGQGGRMDAVGEPEIYFIYSLNAYTHIQTFEPPEEMQQRFSA